MSNSKLKTIAKAAMFANVPVILILMIISWLLGILVNAESYILNFVAFALTPIIVYMMTSAELKTMDGSKISIDETIKGFDFKYWLKIIVYELINCIPAIIAAMIITSASYIAISNMMLHSMHHMMYENIIYNMFGTFIIGILTIIATTIISLYFSLVRFIAYDYKELGIMDTLKKAINYIKGHKKKLFILYLSFILWYIGIAILFIILAYIPFINYIAIEIVMVLASFVYLYIDFTIAKFYLNIKEEKITQYDNNLQNEVQNNI